MLKHFLAMLILSIIVVLFMAQFASFLHYVAALHHWFAGKLLMLFSASDTGRLISHVLALLLIPIIIALIPAFIYWLVRRHEMPYMAAIMWVIWILLAALIAG